LRGYFKKLKYVGCPYLRPKLKFNAIISQTFFRENVPLRGGQIRELYVPLKEAFPFPCHTLMESARDEDNKFLAEML
jgi:hypothetical protein